MSSICFAFFPHSAYPVEMTMMPYPVPTWGAELCETPWVVQSLWWHYLYTMDKEFLRAWQDPIVKGCAFIVDALHNRQHPVYRGILPAAVANDCDTPSQSGWNDAWNHKALRTAARLLTRLGHPRAASYRREADAYRRAFQKAYRAVVAKSKTWRAPDGTRLPFTLLRSSFSAAVIFSTTYSGMFELIVLASSMKRAV